MVLDKTRLRVVAITDRLAMGEGWIEKVRLALEGGVTCVMLREKDLSAASLYPLAREFRRMTRDHGAALVVSDRADVAIAAEADGVHLGWTSLPVEAARRGVGRKCWIGYSAHTLDEAWKAVEAGADYLTFSPVFPTPSKEGLVVPMGLERLRAACAALPLPLIALGGIAEANVASCLEAGAAGVAAIRSLLCSPDPRAAAHRFSALSGLSRGENPE